MALTEERPTDSSDFWTACCHPFTKQLLLVSLACAFFLQTQLVYTDSRDTTPIAADAREGRRLWHANNCQTCHQLHGFGGFLGPDLTNATTRLERGQLDPLLTVGEGQMPAFEMSPDEIDAIWAFLLAMNETGIGQARSPAVARRAEMSTMEGEPPPVASTREEALMQVIAESGDYFVADGYELLRKRACLSCHVLFAKSAIGAPDLARSVRQLSPGELMTVLTEGRQPKMPKPLLSPTERTKIYALFEFMAEHRADTLSRIVEPPGSFWGSLPWWEYE